MQDKHIFVHRNFFFEWKTPTETDLQTSVHCVRQTNGEGDRDLEEDRVRDQDLDLDLLVLDLE